MPYIGALAGAVPAVLVALGQGPQTALYTAILFVVVQTLEGNVIAPLIQKRTVELAPVLTILSQTVLGSLFGPLGLILATPVTAAGVELVKKVYVEDDPWRSGRTVFRIAGQDSIGALTLGSTGKARTADCQTRRG